MLKCGPTAARGYILEDMTKSLKNVEVLTRCFAIPQAIKIPGHNISLVIKCPDKILSQLNISEQSNLSQKYFEKGYLSSHPN